MILSEFHAQLEAARAALDTIEVPVSHMFRDQANLRSELDALNAAFTELAAERDRLLVRINELEAQIPKPPVPAKISWGSSVWIRSGETRREAMVRTAQAFQPLDVVRTFFGPGRDPVWHRELEGIPQHVSFKWYPKNILAGAHDATFRTWLARAPIGIPTWWTLWHEPEDDIEAGTFTASQYRTAWQHLIDLSADFRPALDLRATLCLMEWTLRDAKRNWKDYYVPEVDVLAWDAYWMPGRQVEDVYKLPREVSVAAGKPWAIAETGVSAEHLTGIQRATQLKALAGSAGTGPRPQFVCYFDTPVGNNSTGWPISNDPAALEGWRSGRIL